MYEKLSRTSYNSYKQEYHATLWNDTWIFNKFSKQEIDIDLQRLCFNAELHL